MYSYLLWTEDSPLQLFNSTLLIFDDSPFLFLNNFFNILRFHLSCLSYGELLLEEFVVVLSARFFP